MQKPEKFKIIPSIYALLIRDDKILLSRRFQTGFEDGNYGLVAGHGEAKETLREGLQREAREEIGIEIQPNDMTLVLTMHRNCGDHERLDFFFEVKTWQGEIENKEPHKCDDLSWFPLNELPANTIPYIRTAIECYLKKQIYCEFDW